MIKAFLASGLMLASVTSVMALDGLFNLSASDVQAAIAQQHALQEREAAARAARRQRDLDWGLVVERKYDESCTLKAVAARLGVALNSSVPPPAVIYESQAESWEFDAAYRDEHGPRAERKPFHNAYLSKANTIFIVDGRFSSIRRSVDQDVAGEMARFIKSRYKNDVSANDIEAIKDWFGVEFAMKSPCGG